MDPITLALAKQYTDSVAFSGGGGGGGSGDMLKSVYDTNSNGVVDDSERLGGQTPDFYATAEDLPVNVSELTNDAGYQTETQVDSVISAKGYQTEVQVDTKINAKLSSVYRPQGSILFENLPELTEDKEGYVYNVSDAFTSDERFLGDVQEYPAGTNVVVVNADGVYKFSSLAGVFDMSNFQTKIRGRKGYFAGFVEQDEVGEMDSAPNKNTRTARFVIGTSTAGYTTADCDYLCDGVDDQTEINAAIQALTYGGEIKLLDGVYNITSSISVDKENIKISGCGKGTILKRQWSVSSATDSVVTVSSSNCSFDSFFIDGNNGEYDVGGGLYLIAENLTDIVISNLYSCNNGNYGLSLSNAKNAFVFGSFFDDNNSGISIAYNEKSTAVGNFCRNNKTFGISLSHAEKCIVTNNTCVRGEGTSSDYTSAQHTIYTNSGTSKCMITANNCSGKAPTIAGSGNIADNNIT